MCIYIHHIFTINHRSDWRQWLQKPQERLWTIISLIIGAFPISILVMNTSLVKNASLVIIISYLLFVLINPWFEEGYWRGVMLNAFPNHPKWVSVLYSSFFYAISHPLMWGVFSIANQHWQVLSFTFILGIVWSIAYLRSKSLRWIIFAHFLTDIGNLAVFTFLNLYIPPGM
ncbi:CPBP family intramembrane glutamic endopeptidase [Risungbinella massiliensis]|uniref:CPBP family intramembrane glutamic endopeptidase n=1 Tax=Risungbinella massiliensis TaxID=1329796 RepID=UPI0005CBE4FD|nr:CPBP family intramembrane glutamic endopeptidase [Risungbinella massiliensis]